MTVGKMVNAEGSEAESQEGGGTQRERGDELEIYPTAVLLKVGSMQAGTRPGSFRAVVLKVRVGTQSGVPKLFCEVPQMIILINVFLTQQ